MGDNELAGRQLAEIAASSDSLPHRGEQSLAVLRRVVPIDSAWLALVDPSHPACTTLADTDLPETTRDVLAGPVHARELELAGTTRLKPPQSPSDLPFPAGELQSWAERLVPAGYHEGLALAPCGPGGRHIRFLAVMSADRKAPPPPLRRDLGRLIPLLGLTARELEVLGLIVRGCANQQIARILVVAQRTVATYVEHILAKLSAATRTSAAVRAERAGLHVPLQAQEGQPP